MPGKQYQTQVILHPPYTRKPPFLLMASRPSVYTLFLSLALVCRGNEQVRPFVSSCEPQLQCKKKKKRKRAKCEGKKKERKNKRNRTNVVPRSRLPHPCLSFVGPVGPCIRIEVPVLPIMTLNRSLLRFDFCPKVNPCMFFSQVSQNGSSINTRKKKEVQIRNLVGIVYFSFPPFLRV